MAAGGSALGSNVATAARGLRALARRRWLIAYAAVLVPSVAVAAALARPPLYEASSRVVLTQRLAALEGADPQSAGQARLLVASHAEVARTTGFAERVLLAGGVRDMTAEELLRRAQVSVGTRSDVVEFRARAEESGLAEQLATAYAQEFAEYRAAEDAKLVRTAAREVRDEQRELARQGERRPVRRRALAERSQRLRDAEAVLAPHPVLVTPAREPRLVQPRVDEAAALALAVGLALGLGLAALALVDPAAAARRGGVSAAAAPFAAAVSRRPLAVTVLVSVLAGLAAARLDPAAFLALALLPLALLAAIVRPELLIVAWTGLVLAAGQPLTRIEVEGAGRLYPAEILVVLLVLAALLVLVRRGWERAATLTTALAAVLAVAALASLLLRTDLGDGAWPRNLALVFYPALAVAVPFVAAGWRFSRPLFVAVLLGSAVAVVLVLALETGAFVTETTSTGTVRIAHPGYAIPFAVAPLLVFAAVRERLLRREALVFAIPFLLALVFLNYRSAWLAFAAALLVILATGRRLLLAVGAAAAVVAVVLALPLVRGAFAFAPGVEAELERAASIADTSDPNAQYRLAFWDNLADRVIDSPLLGHGFDRYPDELVPPRQRAPGSVFQYDPHNSFLALAYRVGLVPVLVALALLAVLLGKALVVARLAASPLDRATAAGVAAVVVYVAGFSALNVGLEVPYIATVFWIAVGLLAVVAAQPWPRRRAAAAE